MLEQVVAAKQQLIAENVSIVGVEGAWNITNRAAALCAAGLLEKASGNNFNGYAVDIVCFPDGHIWDVLVDGGGANEPSWQDKGMVDKLRFRPPVGAAEPPPPPPDEGGPDLVATLVDIARRLAAIEAALAAVPASHPPNYVGRVFGATIVLRPE